MTRIFQILAALCALCSFAFSEEKPNIVIILADDLGYGDVQSLNPTRGKIATPNLDRLAGQGMTFTDAHSGSSVCTPTRYGLLTGRYAWRTRLKQGVLDGGNDEPLIAADRLTLPAMLRERGYHTACIGKWHLGFTAQLPDGAAASAKAGAPVGSVIVGGPLTRGFDYFLGVSNARTMTGFIEGDKVIERIDPIAVLPRLEKRAGEYIGERAAEAKSGRPFFLYLPLTSPHTPIVPSADWRGKSGLGDYADFVMQTDAVVGSVLASLEKSGIADNTLVIFSADNGCSPAAGTAKLEKAGHFPSAQYRGYKSDIWEGGHRIPLIIRWPGKVKSDSKNAALIGLGDIMATCAEITGAKLPEAAAPDSVSFLSTLSGLQPAQMRDSLIHHSVQGRFAIRSGQWKLCLCAGSGGWSKGGEEGRVQLYDLTADPGETTNMAAQKPEVVERLTASLHRQITEGRSTPGAKQSNDTPVKLP